MTSTDRRNGMTQRLTHVFGYHPPRDEDTANRHAAVRDGCLNLARTLDVLVPTSPEKDQAIARLREVMMWANAGIACHPTPAALATPQHPWDACTVCGRTEAEHDEGMCTPPRERGEGVTRPSLRRWLAVAAAVTGLLAGPTVHATAAPTTTGGVLASTALRSLPVKGRAPKTGYDRAAKFGPAWKDVDRNGCDTRNDVLRRDLTAVRLKPGSRCLVASGILLDPYTGTRVAFVRGPGTSTKVQIDHVVALMDAWQKGAQQWTQAKRVAFANDPLNLLATQAAVNQRKGASDAATWLPPRRSYWCPFVARQIAVKRAHGLWVTAAERDAMSRVLAGCPTQKLPTR